MGVDAYLVGGYCKRAVSRHDFSEKIVVRHELTAGHERKGCRHLYAPSKPLVSPRATECTHWGIGAWGHGGNRRLGGRQKSLPPEPRMRCRTDFFSICTLSRSLITFLTMRATMTWVSDCDQSMLWSHTHRRLRVKHTAPIAPADTVNSGQAGAGSWVLVIG